ncbi:MAG: radical SAM family heme chaperone HemW [Actinomycetes bacterium]
MPSQPVDGEPAPTDGSLPATSSEEFGQRPFSFYVHVPYCASRCGYCDFNTYTASELGASASQSGYAAQAIAEVHLARRILGDRDVPVSTVFVGGGTPTLLPAQDLAGMLDAIRDQFGLTAGAEVTTEANPDSVNPESLDVLRSAGFTRISFGMQSVATNVLQVLERTHTPGRAMQAVREAQAAGFEHVNVDLIYGTPGETRDDFARSLDAAISSGADHVSAYSLIVEDGTRLAGKVRRGEIADVDDDVAADRYVQADQALTSAGLDWYEVSNWAKPGGECRHNLAYWRSDDWWGIGPGAHSHIAGTRWWNVRHPSAYGDRIAADLSPAQAREILTNEQQRDEQILLAIRLKEGLVAAGLSAEQLTVVDTATNNGLVDGDWAQTGRVTLTQKGRLLADRLAIDLLS